jgi:23S rRNA pseudouridine2604 synthase
MCELVGVRVIGLKRVRIGKVVLGSLAEGCWRLLPPGLSF